ncbi:MAG TPA: TraR/DksA family transcriptional regulator [Candidatus Paceibacterota bacterium]|nr:TraR/DksA family transcriptional regulator [Candidatus Paceibacterota bacterium]
MISEDKKNQFKNKLEEMKVSLEAEINKLETPPDFGDFPGPDDETDEAAQTFNQKSAAAPLKEELSNVESALIKIENGTYGVCEECGKDIDESLLDAVPNSLFCQDCKKDRVLK